MASVSRSSAAKTRRTSSVVGSVSGGVRLPCSRRRGVVRVVRDFGAPRTSSSPSSSLPPLTLFVGCSWCCRSCSCWSATATCVDSLVVLLAGAIIFPSEARGAAMAARRSRASAACICASSCREVSEDASPCLSSAVVALAAELFTLDDASSRLMFWRALSSALDNAARAFSASWRASTAFSTASAA